ncbi:probable membrane-associated kinase regulator 4 [Cucurbita pepo subsp. pepo]|uniref:probable membrane-associated kinase regulator 4 n=1 Tax=Cucurbita pepo subsp. pepo TaxID=3664 RepID=UPI000C9D3487|nr:probable membrane-associated kinase regulator 4 [Cucurbita pepo subsp. pepo]
MAIGQFSCTYTEDYIEMDISSSSNFRYSLNSPPQPREFEFQMNAVSLGRETAISPADELFYKGKLLPLHLPPRIQMVQKLIQNSNAHHETEPCFEENFQISFISTSSVSSTNASIYTPHKSFNFSPAESCRFSFELKPVDHWTNAEMGSCQELKQNRQSSLFRTLKASRAYIRSLFNKSACTDESCAKLAENRPKRKEFGSKRDHVTATLVDKDRVRRQRRASFSASKPSCPSSVSSSGSSSLSSSSSLCSSNGMFDPQVLKRCNSASSEMARSIEGAIAHCKHSHFV